MNNLKELDKVLLKFEKVKNSFNCKVLGNKCILIVDIIVFVGVVVIEKVVKDVGYDIMVFFVLGCMDVI